HCSPVDCAMCTQLLGSCPVCSGRPRTPVMRPKHSVQAEQCLKIIDLPLVDSALRQTHDVDAADLVSCRDEHPIHMIQVEPLGRSKLEGTGRLLGQAVH